MFEADITLVLAEYQAAGCMLGGAWGKRPPGFACTGCGRRAAVAKIGVFEHVLVSKFSMPVPKGRSTLWTKKPKRASFGLFSSWILEADYGFSKRGEKGIFQLTA